jgi:sucrose-6-phosphate hydrolase SacC (GH32 family)
MLFMPAFREKFSTLFFFVVVFRGRDFYLLTRLAAGCRVYVIGWSLPTQKLLLPFLHVHSLSIARSLALLAITLTHTPVCASMHQRSERSKRDRERDLREAREKLVH